MSPTSQPIRVLHVVGEMGRGGVETWLMHVLRHIDRHRFQMDFLVATKDPCAYDDEIRALGGRVIPCVGPHRPWTYAPRLRRILQKNGPYDIVHSHVHHFSGFILRLAKGSGVSVRIAHSHTDTSRIDSRASLARRAYLRLCERWIRQCATRQLACSREAATSLFGSTWRESANASVLHCGIDLQPFSSPVDKAAVRGELGIAPDALVLGHVGRFCEQKNHAFLLKIAAEVAKREPRAVLLLVGDGALRPRVERRVASLGLRDRVIFTGGRGDVHRLMLGAMDVFVFPSLCEGLGLVLVEAQAAGLPCFASDGVPTEAYVVKPLVRPLSLAQPAAVWAEQILSIRRARPAIRRDEALSRVERSSFSIESSCRALEAAYNVA
jgi:glycosyltransferase involved in cell wall biosynthesis